MKKRQERTSKRAEIPDMVFVYVMAAVIIAMILLFGYKAIGKLMETTSVTETAKFKVDLKNILTEDTTYGKNDFVRIRIPSGYEELCFVKSNLDSSNDAVKEFLKRYPQALDIAESANNVFLGNSNGKIDSFSVSTFEIYPGSAYGEDAFCVREQSGELKFRIEGMGDSALIVNVS
ncbi:MAG: hypothetical protein NT001_00215 [Candidatus Woesearchaeota archaeon]|nr:hypothetical protein [Candidatus Woesearchaeota archaeon]